MKVILLRDVPSLGRAGTIHNVKEGYARNYLFPRGLAVEATEGEIRRWEERQRVAREKEARRQREAEQVATALSQTSIELRVQSGETGRLFGSITSQHIAEALRARGFPIDKKQVELEEPIKVTGTYRVPVRLSSGTVAHVPVHVVGVRPKEVKR